jgi:predicted nuclease of restriction endonuclease-like (RecB) superfamily
MNMKNVAKKADSLFKRVAAILEQARKNVIRSVNSNMVIAYWLIGREIVQEIQGGKNRAGYGEKVIEELSEKLSQRYGRGFSTTNLRYFRTFYLTYSSRRPEIRQIGSGELAKGSKRQTQSGILKDMENAVERTSEITGFSPYLGWSHYQVLMGIENRNERLFYEIETEKEGWDVKHLGRQIHTFLFARLLKSRDKAGVMNLTHEGHIIREPSDAIKNPYILDFLGLPDRSVFHESEIEQAIIDNIQQFLLELGKGFAFVGRQMRLQFEKDYFNVDLVFYNCILKCYLLIDLKIGELSHQDVGQMDSYVRMFDDKYLTEGDNPTIGLILCAKKNETIARYSVLKDNRQLFASKYMLYLPTEKELAKELKREQKLLEDKARQPRGRIQSRRRTG